jgi:hypothetical protein
MIKQVFNKRDIPVDELERMGLAKDGVVLLDVDDLNALLAGRRTDMLRLEHLELDGVHIEALDAKMSLRRAKDGQVELLLHPIYREPEVPSFLTSTQAEMLEKGEIINLQKMIFDDEGHAKEVLVEFDKDTNEFIITDTEKIQAPDQVNGVPLTEEQKEKYRKGKEVQVDQDGTTLQYSGTEKQGMRSDKLALIASILIDGGVSYMLYKGLNALFGQKEEQDTKRGVGKNYHEAMKNMQEQEARRPGTVLQPGEDFEDEQSHSMSY